MKVIIIGAGASGIVSAISIKQRSPETSVLVIEHTDKALKKILSTGNGKCNIGNSKLNLDLYSDVENAKALLKKYDYQKQNKFLKSIGIETKLVENLSYPISESAVTVRNAMLKACDELGIEIHYEENIINYICDTKQIKVITDKQEYLCDKLIFAVGGASLPKSGSDGSLVPLFEKHGYLYSKFIPGLCSIETKEKTAVLDGTRVKASVILYKDHNLVAKEDGEVLFKTHGLSGIVIMNLSRIVARDLSANYTFEVDALPTVNDSEILNYIDNYGEEKFMNAYLHPNLIKYIQINRINLEFAKRLPFAFKSLADFEHSQISIGGIEFSNLDKDLQSKKEPNVYFAGELLNMDGPCGGYNLSFAFASALTVAKAIK